jgi:hypothetical protein
VFEENLEPNFVGCWVDWRIEGLKEEFWKKGYVTGLIKPLYQIGIAEFVLHSSKQQQDSVRMLASAQVI